MTHSAAQLDALWDAPVGVAFLDQDLRYVRVNRALAEINGVPPEDHIGRTLREVQPDQDPAVEETARRVLETGVAEPNVEMSGRLPRAPGQRLHWLVSWYPVREHGRIIGVGAVIVDITERKRQETDLAAARERADEERRRIETILGTLPVGLSVAEAPTGRIVLHNEEAVRLVGHRIETVGGYEQYAAFGALHPDGTRYAAQDYPTVRAWMRGEMVRSEEMRYRRGDGAESTLLVNSSPIVDREGRVVGAVTAFSDISDRKRLEEELRAADRRKDEFLGMLSHELRNPLASIQNALHVLERSPPEGERAARSRAIVRRQVAHLTRLVDDLLDVTRIARGKIQLRLERLDVSELVRRAVEDHRPMFSRRDIALAFDAPARPVLVDGDAARLTQVLGNLLANAAKFTDAGGEVRVAVAPDGDAAKVRVRDTGVGIRREILPHVFDAFVQADESLHRAQGGLGLGLALVKGLVALHGGTVEAASDGAGRGAEFTFRLPLADPVRASPAAEARRASAGRPRRRVLVIEDNADAAETLRDALELEGHAVELAFDGRAGLEKARAFRPEVVVCDVGLPEMDGYEVARALRAEDASGELVLVALTGYARPEDQARALEAGFDAHVSKPVAVEVLESVIRSGRAAADAAPVLH